MAFPHSQGLLPSEVAFLCEMELVTIIPRQRFERLDLLGVSPTQSFAGHRCEALGLFRSSHADDTATTRALHVH